MPTITRIIASSLQLEATFLEVCCKRRVTAFVRFNLYECLGIRSVLNLLLTWLVSSCLEELIEVLNGEAFSILKLKTSARIGEYSTTAVTS